MTAARRTGLVLAALAALPASLRAWGPSGHRMVTETAALLLERDGHPWAPLLSRHRVEMGFYSIVPDASFRHDDGARGAVEGPTHFFKIDPFLPAGGDSTAAAAALDAVPCPLGEARARAGIARDEAFGQEVGTAPWRIAQLLASARAELARVGKPKGGYKPGRGDTGDAGHIFQALYLLGLASHYTGDAGMPYHAAQDWNGFKTGQGGIHFYFEFDCVNALEPGLSTDVLALARRNRARWIAEWSRGGSELFAVLKRAYLDSFEAVPAVARIDRQAALVEPSPADGKGFARRRPAAEACPRFRALLAERLARAAVLTAWSWQTVLPRDTDLSEARTLQFADMVLAPSYIPPAPDSGCPAAATKP